MTITIRTGKSRLTRELRTLRAAIALQERTLGGLTYAAHCGDLSGSSALPGLLANLDALHAQLEQREKQLAVLRGGVPCPACGAVNPGRSVYCGSCGHALAVK